MVTHPGRHTTTLLHPRLRRLGLRRLTRAHRTLAERPELGRLAAGALEAASAALAQELQVPVHIEARLLESEAVLHEGLTPLAAFLVLELSALGATAVLELEPGLLLAGVERVAGSTARSVPVTRLTRIEEATFAYLALCALGAFRAADALERALSVRLATLTLDRPEAMRPLDPGQRHVCVELRVSVGTTVGAGRLLLPSAALQVAAQGFARESSKVLAPELAAAALPLRCFVGATRLSPDVFASLAPGDVVLFEGLGLSGRGPTGPARLVARGFTLLGLLEADGFTLNRALPGVPPQEEPMKLPLQDADELPPLPVELEVELARISLSLAELATLRAGVLLPLRIAATEPVLLRIGTRAVARAELVDIEGEVGARILELLP